MSKSPLLLSVSTLILWGPEHTTRALLLPPLATTSSLLIAQQVALSIMNAHNALYRPLVWSLRYTQSEASTWPQSPAYLSFQKSNQTVFLLHRWCLVRNLSMMRRLYLNSSSVQNCLLRWPMGIIAGEPWRRWRTAVQREIGKHTNDVCGWWLTL